MQFEMSENNNPVKKFGAIESLVESAKDFEAFYESDAAETLRDQILDQSTSVKVISFDVFDTILWRDAKSELARFADMAERFKRHMPDLTQASCVTARVLCAYNAYQLSERIEDTTEGRLYDIAMNIMHALRLEDDRLDKAQEWTETEIEIETEQLRLSPFLDDLIDRLKADGKKIMFLSDMYLQEDQIHLLLEKAGCRMDRVDWLISTADIRVNKRSGTVFAHVTEDLDLRPQDILHMGDSLQSDFRNPAAAGWKTRYLPVPIALRKQRRESHFETCDRLFGDRQFTLPMSVPAI